MHAIALPLPPSSPGLLDFDFRSLKLAGRVVDSAVEDDDPLSALRSGPLSNSTARPVISPLDSTARSTWEGAFFPGLHEVPQDPHVDFFGGFL